MERIILFDGVCNLCTGSVQFILKRDPNGSFQFASLQGDMGQKLLKQYNLPTSLNSFLLIEDGKPFMESTAALRVCLHLKGAWKLLGALLLIPRPIRDLLYKIIARNRYKWFGKRESCMLPLPEWKNRFLE
ncbi:thiol-disulfide oxidoreductase DCC family protein [Neobacillus dielmonensis]|uniref:thiol-disulfide oxidoreductase DCC family protein n=1 Tax=Neobacillus dielmonensis TaxID=1347369 RepID=UPI0005A6A835|nr:thiol-disulfide oxidoreductase DCC family protein [Neobacillus dielmonensis]